MTRNKSMYTDIQQVAGGGLRVLPTYTNTKIKRKNVIGKINRAVRRLLWGVLVGLLLK